MWPSLLALTLQADPLATGPDLAPSPTFPDVAAVVSPELVLELVQD